MMRAEADAVADAKRRAADELAGARVPRRQQVRGGGGPPRMRPTTTAEVARRRRARGEPQPKHQPRAALVAHARCDGRLAPRAWQSRCGAAVATHCPHRSRRRPCPLEERRGCVGRANSLDLRPGRMTDSTAAPRAGNVTSAQCTRSIGRHRRDATRGRHRHPPERSRARPANRNEGMQHLKESKIYK